MTYLFEIGEQVEVKGDDEHKKHKVLDRFIDIDGVEAYSLEGECNGTKYKFTVCWFDIARKSDNRDRIEIINSMQ